MSKSEFVASLLQDQVRLNRAIFVMTEPSYTAPMGEVADEVCDELHRRANAVVVKANQLLKPVVEQLIQDIRDGNLTYAEFIDKMQWENLNVILDDLDPPKKRTGAEEEDFKTSDEDFKLDDEEVDR